MNDLITRWDLILRAVIPFHQTIVWLAVNRSNIIDTEKSGIAAAKDLYMARVISLLLSSLLVCPQRYSGSAVTTLCLSFKSWFYIEVILFNMDVQLFSINVGLHIKKFIAYFIVINKLDIKLII